MGTLYMSRCFKRVFDAMVAKNFPIFYCGVFDVSINGQRVGILVKILCMLGKPSAGYFK